MSLAGDVSAGEWLKAYLEDAQPVAALGRRLMMPGSMPPSGFQSRGRIVCNCPDVAEKEIGTAMAQLDGDADARLAALQGRLKCGISCGSCIPELKILVSRTSTREASTG